MEEALSSFVKTRAKAMIAWGRRYGVQTLGTPKSRASGQGGAERQMFTREIRKLKERGLIAGLISSNSHIQ